MDVLAFDSKNLFYIYIYNLYIYKVYYNLFYYSYFLLVSLKFQYQNYIFFQNLRTNYHLYIYGYKLRLRFALAERLTGYAKSFSGTVYHDADFAMKLYDLLSARYGTPVSAEQDGQEITAVTAAGWDRFFLQWSKEGQPENITNEETGLTSRTLRAYWPKEKVVLTLTVSLNTEIEDFLKLQVTFGEMPEPEPEEEEKEDSPQDLIEDSSVEIN